MALWVNFLCFLPLCIIAILFGVAVRVGMLGQFTLRVMGKAFGVIKRVGTGGYATCCVVTKGITISVVIAPLLYTFGAL